MNDEKNLEQEQQAFLLDTLRALLAQDSPSGFTAGAVELAQKTARDLGFETRVTGKGNLVVKVPGRETGRTVGLCAHVDTLGLMVRSVTDKGMLMVTRVGGPLMPTLDGEYCRIYTREGKVYTGTVLRRRCMCRTTPPPVPGTRRTWRCASTRRCAAKRTCWRWASPPATTSATTPRRW